MQGEREAETASGKDVQAGALAGKILIVGGGIGGMALAIALHQRGIASEIVEIDPLWTVYGAGLTVTGPTLRAFRDLGLFSEIEHYGAFVPGNRIFLYDGTPLGEQSPPPAAPGLPSSGGIMRPILQRIMSEDVRRRAIPVRLGTTVEAIEPGTHDRPAQVRFSDGTHGEYDVVVGADGIYSHVRDLCFPDAVKPVYTGQMIWRVVAPRPREMDRAEFFFGHEYVGGIIPCAADKVYAFILHPSDLPVRHSEAEQPAALRATMAPFGGSMKAIRESVGPQSSIVHRPFEYALQPAPWHRERVVLMGDAAHATTPHLASGAGMAVEDALVLAEELARVKYSTGAGATTGDALQHFTARRHERCRFVVETSVTIGEQQLRRASPDEIGMLMGQGMARLAQPI